MKVKELLEEIKRAENDYPDFLDWDIALEHVENPEQDISCKNAIIVSKQFDDEWKFIKSHCLNCATYFIKDKIFGIQVHY